MPWVAPVVRVALVVEPEEPVAQRRRSAAVWQRAGPVGPVEVTPRVTAELEVLAELPTPTQAEPQRADTAEPEEP